MMEILKDFPEGVVGARATGRVTKKDYDAVLVPAVEEAFGKHDKLRCYYEIGPAFTGFDVGAMWEDFSLGISHWLGWERVAVVTDVDWITHAMNTLRFLMPCPVKAFPLSAAGAAREWVMASGK